jgi:hypothetical protein
VVNRYISVEQLTTDAKLAGVLAVGGPIRYKLKDDSHVSLQFLKSTVAPKMHEHFGVDPSNLISDVLALPLLWACHEPSLSHMIHPQVLSRVQQGYNSIRGKHGNTYNPVYKVPLHISRVENLVFIQDAVTMGEGGGEATGSQAATAAAQSSQIQTLLLSINRLEKRQAENQQQLQQHMSEMRSYTATQFKQVHTNMNRFAASPSRRLGKTRPGVSDAFVCHTLDNTYDSTAKLSSCPRNLLLLWQEYLYGLEGNKAAKDFTSVERGRVKFKFCRRKCFWEVMVKLCNAGFTDLSSIDKVHQAYGMKLSVSAILALMMKDRKVGGHPNLCL